LKKHIREIVRAQTALTDMAIVTPYTQISTDFKRGPAMKYRLSSGATNSWVIRH